MKNAKLPVCPLVNKKYLDKETQMLLQRKRRGASEIHKSDWTAKCVLKQTGKRCRGAGQRKHSASHGTPWCGWAGGGAHPKVIF